MWLFGLFWFFNLWYNGVHNKLHIFLSHATSFYLCLEVGINVHNISRHLVLVHGSYMYKFREKMVNFIFPNQIIYPIFPLEYSCLWRSIRKSLASRNELFQINKWGIVVFFTATGQSTNMFSSFLRVLQSWWWIYCLSLTQWEVRNICHFWFPMFLFSELS